MVRKRLKVINVRVNTFISPSRKELVNVEGSYKSEKISQIRAKTRRAKFSLKRSTRGSNLPVSGQIERFIRGK